MAKFEVPCRISHIYWKNPWSKTSFLNSDMFISRSVYICPDGCCTRFNIQYFNLYLFYSDFIFKLIMTIDSDILLRNHVCCNFPLKYYSEKYYPKIFLRQVTKTLSQFLTLSRTNKNLEICLSVLFELFNESKLFWVTFFV